MTKAAPLNLERLTDLLGDDHESIAEILELACGTASKALGQLAEGRDETDAIRRAAHALKGGAANVGADELAALAAALEDDVRDGHPERIDVYLAELPPAFERFQTAVREYRLSNGV